MNINLHSGQPVMSTEDLWCERSCLMLSCVLLVVIPGGRVVRTHHIASAQWGHLVHSSSVLAASSWETHLSVLWLRSLRELEHLTLYPCLLKKRQGLYCWFGKIKILPVINRHSCNHADGTASLGWSERQSMYSYHSNLRCYFTEIWWLRDRKRLTASTSDERRKENDNWVKKCPECECQISFVSSLQKIERISAGPLDRRTMAQAMRGGGGEQNSGSSLRKNKAIYDISNVCHLFTT